MKALIKIILGLVLLVILLVGGAAVALLSVDPNSYKTQISSAVKDATGRDLKINGDISVVFYPVLGFKAAGVEVGNTADFTDKNFIKADEVQAGVKILPLLSKKVEITTVRLVAPQITIIKKADGSNNLAMPQKNTATATKAPALDISVEGINISKAKVTYIDKAAGKTTVIDPLNLQVPRYSRGRDVDVALDMSVHQPAPARPLSFALKTTVDPDPAQGVFTFRNLKAHADLGGAQASATAGVVVNTKAEDIKITNLETGWQGTALKGAAHIKGFKNPFVSFDISSPAVDLDALMPSHPGAPKDHNRALLPLDLLRMVALDGKVNIGTLKAAGLRMDNVKLNVKARSGLLNIAPLTLDMYDGTLTTDVQIDARAGNPVYHLKGGLKNLEVGKLLTAKMGQDYLTGVSNIDFDLNTRGNTMNAINAAAGGQIKFDFGKGYINKWQLSRLMNQAISYFEKGKMDENASDRIYFTSLDAIFTGQNGVFRNDDLVLIGPKSHALGSGSINLASQNVDYTVRVGGGDNPEKFAKKKHLPVRMTGPFSKPSYAIDMQALIQEVAGEKIEEKKQEVMQKLFEKLDKKAAKDAPPATGTESAPPVEGATAPAEPAPPKTSDDPLKALFKGLR